MVDPAGTADVLTPETQPEAPAENPDPLKQRIHAHPPRNRFKRLIYNLLGGQQKRELLPEEIAAMEEEERRRALYDTLRREAELFKPRIRNTLNRLGLCYRYKSSERDFLAGDVKPVEFDYCYLTPEALYFHIDTHRLPFGVQIISLMQPEVVTEISIACGKRVSSHFDEQRGAMYIVERASGALGIPRHVMYSEMLRAMPATADALTVPLGMARNSKPVYRSLNDMISVLVGGETGSGKSNLLNVVLCTLIRRNTPDRLKLVLVDLKGGLEFDAYYGIPHLLPIAAEDDEGNSIAAAGIISRREHVPLALAWLHAEGERRINVLKRAGVKDIARYNHHHRGKKHMPHLVFIIDEWADVKLIRGKKGQEAEDLLINIVSRYRAVGIHVIPCTQTPRSDVIDTRIKNNLPAKIAFSCSQNHASMAILDNAHAKGLQPTGRFILQFRGELEIQAPYINDKTIRETVAGAIAGHYDELAKGHDVTEDEVMNWALENDTGWLSERRLFAAFNERGLTQAELRAWLASWEGNEFTIGLSTYRVNPAAGNRSRRLVAVDVKEDPE